MKKIDSDKIYQKLIDCGSAWADKELAASLLENTVKEAFSEFVVKHKATGLSVAEAEHRAKIEPDYRDYVVGACTARSEATKAKVAYHAAQAWVGAQMDNQATQRQEAKLVGVA